MDRSLCFSKCCISISEDLIAKVADAIPTAGILRITAKLVEAVSAIGAKENIHADVFTI